MGLVSEGRTNNWLNKRLVVIYIPVQYSTKSTHIAISCSLCRTMDSALEILEELHINNGNIQYRLPNFNGLSSFIN